MADQLEVAISDLDTGHNVRTSLGDIEDLAASIADVGILTPVTVSRRTLNGGGYTLIAGHRRVAAAEQVGIASVPAINVGDDVADDERVLGTLIENLLRLDLDPVEEAQGYERLVSAGWNQNKIARRLQRSKGHISKRRRLLGLPAEVQDMVSSGTITTEHGYKLGRLANQGTDGEALTRLAKRSVYYTDEAINRRTAEIAIADRKKELTKKGVPFLSREDWNPNEHRRLDWTNIDTDAHPEEPCHRILIDRGYQGNVVERQACVDIARHRPDGESELKEVTPEDKWEAERAERDAKARRRAAERDRLRVALGTKLADVAEETAVSTALRILAYDHLEPPPPTLPQCTPDVTGPLYQCIGQQHSIVEGSTTICTSHHTMKEGNNM